MATTNRRAASSKTAGQFAQTTRASSNNRRQRDRRQQTVDRRGPNAIGGRRASDNLPIEQIMSQVQASVEQAAAAEGAANAAARSAAIAASWSNPEVRAARAARHQVKVGKTMYKSVPAAFRELGLPMTKMIRFRGDLVKSETGVATFEHEGAKHKFTIVHPEPAAEAAAQ